MTAQPRSSEGAGGASPAGIPGDVQGALADVNVPSYVVDRFGIIRWLNPAADKALQDGHSNPNRPARRQAYADFQRAFEEDVPAIVLSNPLYIYATRAPAFNVTLPNTDLLSVATRFDTIDSWSLQAP